MMIRRMPQNGFTLLSAIFILTVLAALGTYAATLAITQHRTSLQDAMGTRALQAARAGIEWGLFQILQGPNGGGIACDANGAPNAVVLPAVAATLTSFSVNVSCQRFAPVMEGQATTTIYRLVSTATSGAAVGAADYVERRITVTVAN
jgi:MSHA biogenesis protein MshP